MTTKIKVTKEHIENGKPCDGESCPIALALKEAGVINPHVEADFFWFKDSVQCYDLPPTVSAFINVFDLGQWALQMFIPFEFEIDLSKPMTNDDMGAGDHQ